MVTAFDSYKELDPDAKLLGWLKEGLHSEVQSMNPDNFMVRMRLEAVERFQKKVEDYLKSHLDDLVIHRLRMNEQLTPVDLQELEAKLQAIGEKEGETLLSRLLERSGSPSLVHFVRGMVGMDRAAAQSAFSKFLTDRSLTVNQIRFIEMVIEQLTARGVMDLSSLYEPPFSDINSGGPDEVTKTKFS